MFPGGGQVRDLGVRGVTGHLKWYRYIAAEIHAYCVTKHHPSGHWTLSGMVGTSDAFKLTQRPLMFAAPHKDGVWTWPIESLEIVSGRLTARLGPPIEAGVSSYGIARPRP